MLFRSRASKHARRPGSSCEWRIGLFPWRCPGAPASRCCSSRVTWEGRGVGASWGAVEAAAPPAGIMAPPPDPAARGSLSRIRTTPLAWLRSPECRGCSQAMSPAPSVGTWPPARAGADGPALDEPIVVIPFLLGAMVMMKSMCYPSNQIFTACAPYLVRQRFRWKRHLWDLGESLLRLAGAGLWKERV